MSAILLTAPAVEPVSLDEARAFLRVEHHDDDEVIAALNVFRHAHKLIAGFAKTKPTPCAARPCRAMRSTRGEAGHGVVEL